MSPREATPPVSVRALVQGTTAGGGDLEQDPAVDVIGQEARRVLGDPGQLGVVGKVGGYLGTGIAATDDD